MRDLANAVFGALDDIVVGLAGRCPPRGMNINVSCVIAPTACWELSQKETRVCVSSIEDDKSAFTCSKLLNNKTQQFAATLPLNRGFSLTPQRIIPFQTHLS